MKIVTYVKLEDSEQRILKNHGLPNIVLAFPDVPADDRPPAERRALNHLIDGNAANREQYERAADALVKAWGRAKTESDAEWWLTNCFRPVEDDAPRQPNDAAPSGGGVGLVVNPAQFAQDMALTRASQARELAECLRLIERALAILPVEAVDEDEG